jgi:hypothetical protein
MSSNNPNNINEMYNNNSSNLFKIFKNDLKKAVLNDIDISRTKKVTPKNIFLFSLFLGMFVMAKPVFIYYKGYCERVEKIKQLKRENKFVLNMEENK